MEKYSYPDEEDKLTTTFITQDSNAKYWEESEKNILNAIINKIKNMPKKPKLLDLGCGTGRLFSVFYSYVESITGVEPDESRASEAVKEAEKIDDKKIKVLNGDISAVKDKKFDVIVVSHVFQHIALESVVDIVSSLRNIIEDEGLLCITTTYSGSRKDILSLEYSKKGKREFKRISKKRFNKIVNTNTALPVRKFSINTIKSILNNNNFTIQQKLCYHFKKEKIKSELSVEKDNKLNETGDIQHAIDVLYVCKKKHKSFENNE